MGTPKVTFGHTKRDIDIPEGEWLYDADRKADGGIPFFCKAGACGTCATEVKEGRENLGEQTAREVRTLTRCQLDPSVYRLPCLCDVQGDIVFGQPHNAADKQTSFGDHEVTVEAYRPLNAMVAEVRFFVETSGFEFKPGQYMVFHVPHAEKALRRSHSISTHPSDKRHFEVCVRSVAGGSGSNFIPRLRTGRRLKVEGPTAISPHRRFPRKTSS